MRIIKLSTMTIFVIILKINSSLSISFIVAYYKFVVVNTTIITNSNYLNKDSH